MITHRPEHLEGFDYLGPHRYFLTFCTHDRHRAFVRAEPVDLVTSHILRVAGELRFAVTAYCFMPDHLHLLVEGIDEGSDCLAFIARSKQFSGFYYKRLTGRRLWQRYGYERTLRSDESSLAVTRYIIENPVRAGLAARVDQYPFVGSSVYTVEQLIEAVQMVPAWRRSG